MQQLRLISNSSQLNMFRAIIFPIFRSIRLCVTACGIITHDVAGHRQQYRQPNRCNNNGILIIPVSSTCFGKLFYPSSGALDCVLQFVV